MKAKHLLAIASLPLLLSFPMSAHAADPSGNIQLNMPSQIQYRVKADGSLASPSPELLSLRNASDFEVRVEGVRFVAENGFNIVDDASASLLPNSVSIKLGTEGEKLDLVDYTNVKRKVGNEIAWTMTSTDVGEETASLPLVTEGYGSNIETVGTVGSVEWYVVSDTVTNQVMGRLETLEDWKAGVDAKLEELSCPFPVGSIFQLNNGTDPNTLYPGTTWEKIEGKFLLGSSSSHALGSTGGEETHVLTAAETAMKSHSHTMNHGHGNSIKATTPKFTHSITQPAFTLPNHVHNITHGHGAPLGGNSGTTKLMSSYGSYGGTDSSAWGPWWGSGWSAKDNVTIPNYTGNSGNPTTNPACTRSTNVGVGDHAATACTMSGGVTDYSGSTGSTTDANGSAHNNMPPYETVNIWKRTA